jgi:hypothetical protein
VSSFNVPGPAIVAPTVAVTFAVPEVPTASVSVTLTTATGVDSEAVVPTTLTVSSVVAAAAVVAAAQLEAVVLITDLELALEMIPFDAAAFTVIVIVVAAVCEKIPKLAVSMNDETVTVPTFGVFTLTNPPPLNAWFAVAETADVAAKGIEKAVVFSV